jgi:hypothetical protein
LVRKGQILKGLTLLRTRFDELNQLVEGRKLEPKQQKACLKAAAEIRVRAERVLEEFEPTMVLVALADPVAEPPAEVPHELMRLQGEAQLLLDDLNARYPKPG